MAMKISLDSLARDVAFEIELGGDRLEPADLREMLNGISRAKLDLFRRRVEYHAVDFYPPLPFPGAEADAQNAAFVRKYLDMWTDGVVTAEDLGVQLEASPFLVAPREDRGVFFLFPDGDVRRCTKATREAMWPKEDALVMEHLKPLPAEQAVEVLVGNLRRQFAPDRDSLLLAFPFDVPDGSGRCVGISFGKEGFSFVGGDGSKVDVRALDDAALADILIREVEEHRCLEQNRFLEKGSMLGYLRARVDALLDRFGERVMLDFPYDVVVVGDRESDGVAVSPERIMRSVDDLNPDRRSYAVVGPEGEPSARWAYFETLDYERATALLRRVDREMEYRISSELLLDGIRLENGPVVCVPFAATGERMLKVQSVFTYNGTDLLVSGLPDGCEDAPSRVMRLSSLSDNGVAAVRRATDMKMAEIMAAHASQSMMEFVAVRRGNSADVQNVRKTGPKAPKIG